MEKQEYQFCIRCGRRLKTQEARERGMGRVCAEKYKEEENKRRLFQINQERDVSNEEELCRE